MPPCGTLRQLGQSTLPQSGTSCSSGSFGKRQRSPPASKFARLIASP
eukprot:CAMPEP_0184749728 /NCGR_PEP_ID=MMETSP0315-20130426/30357_1 /TAXON_ID=101924 /ORGANISM="Rhodosorus marinus, Strain UTEX LB 2760" /LENGTH=46 /DNA_ID= /DNA_START= /DNA_END= /DNA_ORIENTATION=